MISTSRIRGQKEGVADEHFLPPPSEGYEEDDHNALKVLVTFTIMHFIF
jgi:hypothetical protein